MLTKNAQTSSISVVKNFNIILRCIHYLTSFLIEKKSISLIDFKKIMFSIV